MIVFYCKFNVLFKKVFLKNLKKEVFLYRFLKKNWSFYFELSYIILVREFELKRSTFRLSLKVNLTQILWLISIENLMIFSKMFIKKIPKRRFFLYRFLKKSWSFYFELSYYYHKITNFNFFCFFLLRYY
jgi:hypothetical protein